MTVTIAHQILGRPPIHPFPARMAPELAFLALGNLQPGSVVVDPMAGSGTVIAVARSKGAKAIGFDVDPLAVLLARVWTTAVDAKAVRRAGAHAIFQARRSAYALQTRACYPVFADEETKSFIRYWFDEYSRRQLTALATAIRHVTEPERDVLWCAFSRMIITKQAGASLAMDLSHSRPHKAFRRAPRKPFDMFEDAVDKVLTGCIDRRLSRRGPATRVTLGDARDLPLDDGSVDVVFTSPPYLNAIDYLRCSKFSLVWMGYSISQLREIRRSSIGTEVGASRKAVIDELIGRVRKGLCRDTRFGAIIRRYVGDLHSAVTEVRRILRPTGRAIFVVGENTVRDTFVPTGRLLASIAGDNGLRLVSRSSRPLPTNRRYLPPPGAGGEQLNNRMRREVVLEFAVGP